MSTPQSANINFTQEEARVTIELFNAAVKALGLAAAESAVMLTKKINAAFEPPKENVLQQLPQ